MIPVFWIEPTGEEEVSLRRFKSSRTHPPGGGDPIVVSTCPLPWGYHDESTAIGREPDRGIPLGDPESLAEQGHWGIPTKDDPRWPTHCDCGYVFQTDDEWQVFRSKIYRAIDGHWEGSLRDAPPGAMYDAHWMHDVQWAMGPDGISLHVITPDGFTWCVDQEASNCTRPQFIPVEGQPNTRRWGGRSHYCWVRHGDPRDPQGRKTGQKLHVDKAGDTCAAGAGSIMTPKWHGFLHHGELRSC